MLMTKIATAAIAAVAATGYYLHSRNNNINPVTIEELAGKFSESCDEVIIKTQKENKEFKFISGVFKVTLSESFNKTLVSADMYFQDENGQWIKKTNYRELKSRELTEEALNELKKLGEVQFEIVPPDELLNEVE